MLNKTAILGSVASLGLALGVASGEAAVQMTHEMAQTAQTTQFRRIEQPLGVKAAVTAGGLALIGLEMWWFLLSKPKSQKAGANHGIQERTDAAKQQ